MNIPMLRIKLVDLITGDASKTIAEFAKFYNLNDGQVYDLILYTHEGFEYANSQIPAALYKRLERELMCAEPGCLQKLKHTCPICGESTGHYIDPSCQDHKIAAAYCKIHREERIAKQGYVGDEPWLISSYDQQGELT